MLEFKNLNLSDKIVSQLEKKGYTQPTPIQVKAIPHILEGKDLMGIAQTGTGKTAAFALPVIDLLSKNHVAVKSSNIRCLVLTPTRELATQIAENIEVYGAETKLKHAIIFGGVNENAQIKKLAQGNDIVIATPGRLLDLMSQGYVQFSQLEIFILDEADRMLDMGFINDVKKIISRLPQKRQTLFFSATMSDGISSLAHSILKDPVKVEVTPAFTTVEKITQKVYMVDRSHKSALLKTVIKQDDVKNVLVFSQTKHGANKIAEYLRTHGVKVMAIHGNKSQAAREKALADFKNGHVQVLVATDIAARGIDVPGISHVINYHIPNDPESYVHRIGRTARAGKEGVAITFCDNSEVQLLRAVEKVIKIKIPVDETHAYHGVEVSAAHRSEHRNEQRREPRPSSSQNRFRGGEGRSNEDRRRDSRPASASGRPSHSGSRFPRKDGEVDGNRDTRFSSNPNRERSDSRNQDRRPSRFDNRSDNPRSLNDRRDNRNFSDRPRRSEGENEGSKSTFKSKVKSFFGFKRRDDNGSENSERKSFGSKPFGARPSGGKKPFGAKRPFGSRPGGNRGRSFAAQNRSKTS